MLPAGPLLTFTANGSAIPSVFLQLAQGHRVDHRTGTFAPLSHTTLPASQQAQKPTGIILGLAGRIKHKNT